MNRHSSQELLCNSNLKRSLSKTNVANFARLYGKIELSPGQERFARWITANAGDKEKQELRQGIAKVGRGGGKTISVATAFAYLHAIDNTLKISVTSGSFEQARYLYAYYEPYLKHEDLFPSSCFKGKPTRQLTSFKEGGFLRVLAASEKQERGGHVDIATLDEAVLIKKDLIDATIPTVRASNRPMLIICSTASPKISYRWFVDKWQNRKKYGIEAFEWKPEECMWINPDTTNHLSLLFDKATAAVELQGEIAELKGFVFGGQSIDRAIADPFNEDQWPLPAAAPLTNWHWCADWGFTHPTVIGDLEIRSDVCYVRDIRIRQGEPINNVIEEIRIDFKDKLGYAGNDGAGEIAQLHAYGLDVQSVSFSTDKTLLISELKRRLERGLIKIPDPKKLEAGNTNMGIEPDPAKAQDFTYLIDELRNYHYDDDGKPEKGNDDCVDMLLYGMKPLVDNLHRPHFKPYTAVRW